MLRFALSVSAIVLLAASWVAAQTPVAPEPQGSGAQVVHSAATPWDCSWVIPQSRRVAYGSEIQVQRVKAGVVVDGQIATTSLEVVIGNPAGDAREARLLIPVPDGAVIKNLALDGAPSGQTSAQLLELSKAKLIYDDIVRRAKDPALLEFVGLSVIQSSVFPIPAHGTQTMRVVYETLLARDGNRIDYVLPRSEAVQYSIPWEISVRIENAAGIATVYSPSHFVDTVRPHENRVSVRLADRASTVPGPFRLSYLERADDVTASVYTVPNRSGDGGYFLFLAGVPEPEELRAKSAGVRREITLVLDRSGSMRGEKIEQAREAVRQVLAGLGENESFNLIVYNDTITRFAESAVPVSADSLASVDAFLGQINAESGTNLHGALAAALSMPPTPGAVPMVLFLTDGLPTVGVTAEKEIRRLAIDANPHEKRVFTFGVGHDVNTPLLDRISRESRAIATYVLPGENVEMKVSSVFKRLTGLVFVEPWIRAIDESGRECPGRLLDVLPGRLPDLFVDDQLVVLGRYLGDEPMRLRLGGTFLGEPRVFECALRVDRATIANAFVSRLWASRKIADLVDVIRDLEATTGAVAHAPSNAGLSSVSSTNTVGSGDPRLDELVREVVALSIEHGILTEYTAFLAQEGVALASSEAVLKEANSNFVDRAINTRWGVGNVNQEFNRSNLRVQSCLNPTNEFLDPSLNAVTIHQVQQINDRAFFYKDSKWVDSRLADAGRLAPMRTVHLGSDAYRELQDRLVREGRPGCLSLAGEIVLKVGDESVLISPEPEPAAAPPSAAGDESSTDEKDKPRRAYF